MRSAHPLMAVLLVALVLGGPLARAETEAHEQLPDDRVLYIAPGQSLTMLVRRLYPDRPEAWADIADWIVEHNAHAFVDGDPARLRADVRVKLPSPSALAATDPYELKEVGSAPEAAVETDRPALRFGRRHVFVDPAQALSELVPRLYPEERSRWDEIIDAIVERNAGRLAELAQDREIARGTRLEIPTVAVAPANERSGRDDSPRAEERPPAPVVARVIEHAGDIRAIGPSGRERSLDTGDPVRRGDMVRTGGDASAELRFEDQERLFLRADTHLRVHDWRLPETGPGTRVIELFEGALRAITGAIGNRSEDTYRTITPQATLGIRGTEYALRLCAEDECRVPGEEPGVLPGGLYVGVDSGRVVLLNEAGETTVAAGGYRYVAGPSAAPAPAGPDVAGVLYTEAERAERAPAAVGEPEATADEAGKPWWWAVIGAVLVGVAL